MSGHSYKAELEGIKAPLGVILYLIKRDNIDVYDIPIAKITRDYLEYLDLMEQLQIDLAGEFFVLAATLMRIKVQMLLRRDDDTEDPREELVRNLLEYKKMVEAAKTFKELEGERMKVFKRPVPDEEKELKPEPVFELSLFEIMRAFREIMSEFESQTVSEIIPEQFTIEEKIEIILERVGDGRQATFKELFEGSSSKLEIVVTFIALLELMKRAFIKCKQEGSFGEIWIYRADPDESEETASLESLDEEYGSPSRRAVGGGTGDPGGGDTAGESEKRETYGEKEQTSNGT
jgi:segregation and condensation protein A